ncbi:hypothetical protein SAMN05444157_3788 [Frankineae bacterium MT45]|nr:hypothetical protein SAMN05444157_3788 [Frankineae bacterium MT45]
MDIELLVIPDCPNADVAAGLLRGALDDVGLTAVSFVTTVVETEADAERLNFFGSPTILIDGHDPFASNVAAPAVACRMYEGPDGPAGVPDVRALRKALKSSARATADGVETPGGPVEAAEPGGPEECWCCGSVVGEGALARLGSHPEVGVCADCARFLNRRAQAIRDADHLSITGLVRSSTQLVRTVVMRYELQGVPVLGHALRWLNRRLP